MTKAVIMSFLFTSWAIYDQKITVGGLGINAIYHYKLFKSSLCCVNIMIISVLHICRLRVFALSYDATFRWYLRY